MNIIFNKKFWVIIRNLSAIAGIFLLYMSASTSDYYILELGLDEPLWVGRCIIVGLIMILPMLCHVVLKALKEGMQR